MPRNFDLSWSDNLKPYDKIDPTPNLEVTEEIVLTIVK